MKPMMSRIAVGLRNTGISRNLMRRQARSMDVMYRHSFIIKERSMGMFTLTGFLQPARIFRITGLPEQHRSRACPALPMSITGHKELYGARIKEIFFFSEMAK